MVIKFVQKDQTQDKEMIVTTTVVMTDVTQEVHIVVTITVEDLDLEVGIEKVLGMIEVTEITVEITVQITVEIIVEITVEITEEWIVMILEMIVEVLKREQQDATTVKKKVIQLKIAPNPVKTIKETLENH